MPKAMLIRKDYLKAREDYQQIVYAILSLFLHILTLIDHQQDFGMLKRVPIE